MHHLTNYLTALAMFVALFLFPPTNLLAGNLDSPAAPTAAGSAMFTLDDIFNRLNSGVLGTKRGGSFVEPGAGPTAGTGKTLDEVMAVAPAVDDAAGATAAEVTQGKQFWGLRSGAWGIQTGTLDPHAIPCSGTRWSNTGEDPNGRWCDNGDGTVTDLLGFGAHNRHKGLVWLKDAGWGGQKAWRVNEVDSHDDAHTRASSLAHGIANLTDGSNVGDWRLPTRSELGHLGMDNGQHGPFTNVKSAHGERYWSSTADPNNPSQAYRTQLEYGPLSMPKSELHYVWPVRDRR